MQRSRSTSPRVSRTRLAVLAAKLAVALVLPFLPGADAVAGTLDQVRQSGRLVLGYQADARPFAFRDEAGKPNGYSAALCNRVAEQVKADLGLASLVVDWTVVTLEGRFAAVRQGQVDLLCGPVTETLGRRQDVAFSIPIYKGGVGALLRSDSSFLLRQILLKGKAPYRPLWRASPGQILERQTFSVIPGTTAERWLAERADSLHLDVKVVPVKSYDEGMRRVLDRSSNVFFGDRAILADAAKRSQWARGLVVLERSFTIEPVALALPRGDEDFRLVVDRALSRQFRAADFPDLYAKWFGAPDDDALAFFRATALPE